MSQQSSEESNSLRAVRMLASGWNIFIFVLYPIIAVACLCYDVTLNGLKDSTKVMFPHSRFTIAMFFSSLTTFWISQRAEAVKRELRHGGYTQKSTTRRKLYVVFSFATSIVLLSWSVWRSREMLSGPFLPYNIIVLADLIGRGAYLFVLSGDIICFTE